MILEVTEDSVCLLMYTSPEALQCEIMKLIKWTGVLLADKYSRGTRVDMFLGWRSGQNLRLVKYDTSDIHSGQHYMMMS